MMTGTAILHRQLAPALNVADVGEVFCPGRARQKRGGNGGRLSDLPHRCLARSGNRRNRMAGAAASLDLDPGRNSPVSPLREGLSASSRARPHRLEIPGATFPPPISVAISFLTMGERR